jgi:hypothetical protein
MGLPALNLAISVVVLDSLLLRLAQTTALALYNGSG